jgi:hypothetical protein
MIPKTVPGRQTRMRDRTVPTQKTRTNCERKNNNSSEVQEGGRSPIQKKIWKNNKSHCDSRQWPSRIEHAPRGMIEHVRTK